MRDPLENVTIGNFLYGLGLSIGSRAGASAPAGCVNLLQQGPMDPPLGDVMLGYPGVFRLIEFKRRSARKTKECVKHTKLAAALSSREDLRVVSREVHWYVETKKGVPVFHVTAKPYLDMFDSSVPNDGLAEFIAALVEQALCPKPACDLKLLPQYLDAVAVFAGKPGATSSGILITVGTDGGVR